MLGSGQLRSQGVGAEKGPANPRALTDVTWSCGFADNLGHSAGRHQGLARDSSNEDPGPRLQECQKIQEAGHR